MENICKLKKQKGTYHVMMTILLVPLLGAIALATDTFFTMASNIQQDSNTEYAALGAVKTFHKLSGMDYISRTSLAEATAARITGENVYLGAKGPQMTGTSFPSRYGIIEFGVYNETTGFIGCITQDDYTREKNVNTHDAVKLTLKTNSDSMIELTFSKILNIFNMHTKNTATVYYRTVPEVSGGTYHVLR